MSPTREERAAEIRSEIERRAVKLFAEQGFSSTTVDQIAQASGVSRRTVFRHFATKEAILFANHVREREVLVGAASEAAGNADQVVRAAILALAAHLESEASELAERARIVRSEPVLLDRAMRTRSEWESALAEGIAAKSPRREVTLKMRVRAAAGVGALHMAVRAWSGSGGGAPLMPVVRRALRDAGFD